MFSVQSEQIFTVQQGWGTCSPWAKSGLREHLMWPASEFLLPNLEYNIASKPNSMMSRYLDSKSSTLPRLHRILG